MEKGYPMKLGTGQHIQGREGKESGDLISSLEKIRNKQVGSVFRRQGGLQVRDTSKGEQRTIGPDA